jgi:hypothetical protein
MPIITARVLNEVLIRFDADGAFQAAHQIDLLVSRDDETGEVLSEAYLKPQPLSREAIGDLVDEQTATVLLQLDALTRENAELRAMLAPAGDPQNDAE